MASNSFHLLVWNTCQSQKVWARAVPVKQNEKMTVPLIQLESNWRTDWQKRQRETEPDANNHLQWCGITPLPLWGNGGRRKNKQRQKLEMTASEQNDRKRYRREHEKQAERKTRTANRHNNAAPASWPFAGTIKRHSGHAYWDSCVLFLGLWREREWDASHPQENSF